MKLRVILSTLMLVSCAVGPEYERPEAELPKSWQNALVESQNKSNKEKDFWWKSFNDKTLNELIDLALNNNYTVKEALHKVSEAYFNLEATRGSRLPSVNSALEFARINESLDGLPSSTATAYSFGGLSLGASWAIDIFGKNKRQIESSLALFQGKYEEYNSSKSMIISSIINQYFLLISNNKRIDIVERFIQTQRRVRKVVKGKQVQGSSTMLDVHQYDMDFYAFRAMIPELKSENNRIIQNFKVLIGDSKFDFNRIKKIDFTSYKIAELQITQEPIDVIRARPDIRLAERNVAFNSAQIGVAKADLYPQFELTGSFGYNSTGVFGSGPTQTSGFWSFGLPISWNIFQGFSIQSMASAKERALLASVERYQDTILRAITEIEINSYRYKRKVEMFDEYEKSVKSAVKSARIVKAMFENGSVDILRVLDIQRSLLQTSFKLVDSKFLLYQSYFNVHQSLGSSWRYSTKLEQSYKTKDEEITNEVRDYLSEEKKERAEEDRVVKEAEKK